MQHNIYASPGSGASLREQLDLFQRTAASLASTSVLGLTILTEPCRYCGGTVSVIGTSCAMHSGRATCCGFGRHVRWISRQDFQRLTEIVDVLGHPTVPIDLRRSFVTGLSSYAAF
jgi:hypothetical protein